MGKKGMEKALGRSREERVARAKGLGHRLVKAIREKFNDGKAHKYGVGNASRDGVPRERFTNQVVSLRRRGDEEESK